MLKKQRKLHFVSYIAFFAFKLFFLNPFLFGEVIYYIAPPSHGGDDINGTGTKTKPWSTLNKAKNVIRQDILTGLGDDITVYFREGTYFLTAPVAFSELDSGTSEYSITYCSYPGEYAVISGGQILEGQWSNEHGNIWSIPINEVASGDWWFRQLWKGRQRCLRSRYPDPGSLLNVTEVSPDYKLITFNESFPGDDLDHHNTELVLNHQWSLGKAKVYSKMSPQSVYTYNVAGCTDHQWLVPQAGGNYDKAYLEHHLDYVNLPNEWFLDQADGKLYFMSDGSNPNQSVFIAPKLQKLLKISGNSQKKIQNIHFRRLGFAHVAMPLPGVGYGGIQAGHFATEAYSTPQYILPLAVEMAYAQNCEFESCCFFNTGTGGIGIGIDCDYTKVKNCKFEDIGANGVMVGWRGGDNWQIQNTSGNLFYSDWSYPFYAPQYSLIENCYFTNCAAEWHGCVSIYESHARYSLIKNNTVTSCPYTGISVGFRWSEYAYSESMPVVEKNHIFNVMRILNDGGGIYHLGNSNNGLIKDNYIHHVHGGCKPWLEFGNNGLFMDHGSTELTIENNLTHDIAGESYRLNKPGDITWVNNHWDIYPEEPEFPQAIADNAGAAPSVTNLKIYKDDACSSIHVFGTTQPYCILHQALTVENSANLSEYLKILPNGYIIGAIPLDFLSTNLVTIRLSVKNPEGRVSPTTFSNTYRILRSDINCDGIVDLEDFAVLAKNWFELQDTN